MDIALDEDLNFRDLAKSAFYGDHKKHGELAVFLLAIDEGRVKPGSVLIVEAIDRLSRMPPLDALDMIGKILRAGIEIHTTEDGAIYTMASVTNGEIRRLTDKVDQAFQYSNKISMRGGAAWKNKRHNVIDRALSKRCPGWLRVENSQYVVIPERAAIVERIFNETVAGLGHRAIVKKLNLEGVPVFDRAGQGMECKTQADMWQHSYVNKLINSRGVLGYYLPHTVVSEGGRKVRVADAEERKIYPQIISHELWDAAQHTKAARVYKGGKNGALNNLFPGLATCAACSGKMMYKNGGNNQRYMICDAYVRGGKCTNDMHYNYLRIEWGIITSVGALHALDVETLSASNDHESKASVIAGLRDEVDQLQKSIDNIVETFLGKYTPPIAKKLVELEETEKALVNEIRTKEKELKQTRVEKALNHLQAVANLIGAAVDEGEERIAARFALRQSIAAVVSEIVFEVNGDIMIYSRDHGDSFSLKLNRQGELQSTAIRVGANQLVFDPKGNRTITAADEPVDIEVKEKIIGKIMAKLSNTKIPEHI